MSARDQPVSGIPGIDLFATDGVVPPAPVEAVEQAPKPDPPAPTPAAPAERRPRTPRQPPRKPAEREWSSFGATATLRLPPELIAELDEWTWSHRQQKGLVVATAIAYLLDQDPELIEQLLEHADASVVRRKSVA